MFPLPLLLGDEMKDNFKNRLRIIYLFLSFFAVILMARLFFVQIVKGDYYQSLANKQYNSSLGNNFNRGSIYFTEKNGNLISAATVKNGFQVAINPKILKNPEETYQKINEIVSIDMDFFMEKIAKKNDPFEIVANKLEKQTAQKISDLKINGVGVYQESWRYYPYDSLASHVLGFVGYKGDKLTGRYGLEAYYEDMLKKEEKESTINSFAELFFDLKKLISGKVGSGDIVLTIEPSVQSMFEKILDKILSKYEGQTAGGVVINPKTGEIIAMAAKPDFNPNQYAKVKNFSIFANPLVESVFEMGSTIKPLTIAAAIDSDKITPETMYDDKGYVDVESARIKNHDNKARGRISMQKVLDESLNTGAVFAMKAVGKEKFSQYFINFGLGEKTGIDLPYEINGKISNIIGNKRELEYATASFGQGIAITPIEMVVAVSSLANGGKIIKPYVVKEKNIKGLKNKINEPKELRQVLKKETADKITTMLVKAVDKALLEGKYKLEHYSVAAKTGTAQISKKGKNGYEEGEYLHAFFGYAPAFDAKFLTFIFIVKPQGVQYAAHSLTEPFMEMTKFLLNFYEIPPDR